MNEAFMTALHDLTENPKNFSVFHFYYLINMQKKAFLQRSSWTQWKKGFKGSSILKQTQRKKEHLDRWKLNKKTVILNSFIDKLFSNWLIFLLLRIKCSRNCSSSLMERRDAQNTNSSCWKILQQSSHNASRYEKEIEKFLETNPHFLKLTKI